MKRATRRMDAEETLAICEAGQYVSPSGRVVELGIEIKDAVAGTVVLNKQAARNSFAPGYETAFSVTSETTLAALRRVSQTGGRDTACLNFASAKNPGGGFLGGAEAQEESLARSSALYPCLLAGPEYYDRNRSCGSSIYLDLAIWSPGVPFFRDDSGGLLEEPCFASVITCPAPNAGAVTRNEPDRVSEIEPALRRRAILVLRIAAAQGVRRLVLGAWGCGVFRNDPQLVARTFAELLRPPAEFAGVFEEVVFAIYDRSPERACEMAFREALLA